MNGYPDPYSFGDTRKIERMLKRDKTEFKMEELKKEEGNEDSRTKLSNTHTD
jgi:hypothetical protein